MYSSRTEREIVEDIAAKVANAFGGSYDDLEKEELDAIEQAVDELESITSDAYDNGVSDGESEGYDQGYQEAKDEAEDL